MEKNDFQVLKEATMIVPIIEKDVVLKKQGSRWVGICPFHKDTEPSLHVSEEAKGWICRACGKKGDVFRWMMLTQGMSFPEAVAAVSHGEVIVKEAKKHLSPKENNWVDHVMEVSRLLLRIANLQKTKLRARRGAMKAKDDALVECRRQWSKAHKQEQIAIDSLKEQIKRIDALEIPAPNLRNFPVYQQAISPMALHFVNGSCIMREQLVALCEKET